MMRYQPVRLVWAAALGAAIVAGARFASAHPIGDVRRNAVRADRALPLATDSVAQWSLTVIRGNPFSVRRRPPSSRYGEEAPEIIAVEQPMRPALTLQGTIGGPPWQGLLSGVPGAGSVIVVRPGDRVLDLRVSAIHRDTVILTANDSLFLLVATRARS